MSDAIFTLSGITKVFGDDDATKVVALDGVSFAIHPGEFTAIVGPSGSGKSTLLNIMSGFEVPTAGTALLAGKDITKMAGDELAHFRRDHVGFVFQAFNLIPVLSVKENAEYVLVLQGVGEGERRERVAKILAAVGLEGKEDRFPYQLSGGQQQRVAIARAMVSEPDIVVADEPTANLDSKTGTDLVLMMQGLNEQFGTTFVFSTHDQIIMNHAKRLITIADGRIDRDERC